MRHLVPALLLLLASAKAGAADSSLRWWTLDAGRVHVHYHQGTERIARRVAPAALEALDALVPRLGWEPDLPIEIVVRDNTDGANGSANVIPYAKVEILPRPPEVRSGLADHDDWVRALVLHEITHVVHLGRTTGLPALVNNVLGRTLVPNLILPPWFIEGLAVYEETARLGGGRARASVVDMVMRADALAHGLPGLHRLSSDPRDWPGGFSRYFYGGRFISWLASERGEAGIARFIEEYGDLLLPYSINRSAKRAWDASIIELWDDWRRAETERAAALVAQRALVGLTRPERLTSHGFDTRYLRLSPDRRRLLYRISGGDALSRLSLLTLDATGRPVGPPRELTRTGSAGSCAWDGRDGTIVFTRRAKHRQFYNLDDLYRLDPETDEEWRLTHGLRARDPDVAFDGRIVFVAAETERSHLVVAAPDGGAQRRLSLPGVREVNGPRWSPDGRWIAVSGWRGGGERDLYLVDPSGTRPARRATRDRALDIDPAWSVDGRAVLFSSDRGGVFDVFAYDVASSTVARVTRLATGGFDPAPGPDFLLFGGYGPDGFDVQRVPLSRSTAAEPADDGPARPALVFSESAQDAIEPTPYTPLDTLRPRAWFPVAGQANGDATYGALVGGRDAVGHHTWLVRTEVGVAGPDLHLLADYAYDRLYPRLGLTLARRVRDLGNLVWAAGRRQPYADVQYNVSAGASFPFSGAFHRHRLSLRYDLELLQVEEPLVVEHDPGVESPGYPRRGMLSGLRIGWRFSEFEQPTFAVSPERGRSLNVALRFRHAAFLSDEESTRLTWSAHQFVSLPWGWHHALAFSLAGGIGSGGAYSRRAFVMGGLPDRDIFASVLDGTFVGGGYLRGYPTALMRGDQEHLIGAEYRMPIASVLRGLFTLPVYLDRVFAAAFADYGAAMRGEFDPDELRLGVGGELRTELVLGYFMPVTVRAGVARGVSQDGITQTYLLAGWVF